MHVVVAGGGVAGLETIIALRDLAGSAVRITLIAAEEDFVYRPLSVTEPFALGKAQRLPLSKVAGDFSAELVNDALESVSPGSRLLRLVSGKEARYDKLVVALGASREPAYEHATTFRGQEDTEPLRGLVQDIEGQYVRKVVFLVPQGIAWTLPIYELALMTAERARDMSAAVELTVVTPEGSALAVFGEGPSAEVAELLAAAGIRLLTGVEPTMPSKNRVLAGGEEIECDRAVALPRIKGRPIPSLPHDDDGFLPIDSHGRVFGADGVYAAGDGTDFPVKQGGIACQQADAVAEVIAKAAGARIEPRSFRPVLRGQLITGRDKHFMRSNIGAGDDLTQTSPQTLWWPPSKVAGRYLAPYLYESDQAAEAERRRKADLDLQEYEVRPD